ncbi:ABC transporter ATP-binding protein [Chlamydia sp. 17-3921]|uniref:ABC transporter ATP-binding protein n=1 Tax=Chlamydia sp. 17-3921 TaxID=2675798 RepID=UPI001919979E|nr:ATP-binding cassette domain-containing protein [Chlamydia sp. 17-3921]
MTPLIEANNLTKNISQYDQEISILTDVSLTLHAGETVAITGPSGNGKTTLLHLLGTLDTPSSGSLKFFGKELKNVNHSNFRNQHIGFVFQNFYLLEDDSVLTNVLLPAIIARVNTSKGSYIYKRALELLESIGLSHKLSTLCAKLSGGEKQRVAIARALINEPVIILADEPSGNLDNIASQSIHELLLSQANSNRGVLIVTHNKKLASQCHREGNLVEGRLLF